MPRHHGFTCPNCGSHYFGTHIHLEVMGDKYPPNTSVGRCQAYLHDKSDCTFEWDRSDEKIESEVIYNQTPEEWKAGQETFLKDMEKHLMSFRSN